jgi:hypothetical protein
MRTCWWRIDEVIYRLDADGEIPVTVAVRAAPDGGIVLSLQLADVGEAEITGGGAEGGVTARPALRARPGGPVVMRDHHRRIAGDQAPPRR